MLPTVQTTNTQAIKPYTPMPIMTPKGETFCTLVDDAMVPGVKKTVCFTE